MKIDTQIIISNNTKLIQITITSLTNSAWDFEFEQLKQFIIQGIKKSNYVYIYAFIFNCNLDTEKLKALASLVAGCYIDVEYSIKKGSRLLEETLCQFCAFVKTLLPKTTIFISRAFTLPQAQMLTRSLPQYTLLRIGNLPEIRPAQGLCVEDLADILKELPPHTKPSISSKNSQLMFEYLLKALPPKQTVMLPIKLTELQCQWVGTYAKQGSAILLPHDTDRSTVFSVLKSLQNSQYLGLFFADNSLLYDMITHLPASVRRCYFAFNFPLTGFYASSSGSAHLSHTKPPLRLGLKTHDEVIIYPGVTLNTLEPLLNDATSCCFISFHPKCRPELAIAIAAHIENTYANSKLLFGAHLRIDWMVTFMRAMPEGHIIRYKSETPSDWLTQLAQSMPAQRQIQLNSGTSVTHARALAQHLAKDAILLIWGDTLSPLLQTVAAHINPLAKIRLHSSVRVKEALIIASHLVHPEVFEVNPDTPVTVHPEVTQAIDLCARKTFTQFLGVLVSTPIENENTFEFSGSSNTLFAPQSELSLSSSSAQMHADNSQGMLTHGLSVIDTNISAAKTMLTAIIERQQKECAEDQADANITLDLPADIPGCTAEILRLAFRKLQGSVRLHDRTTIPFGTMVAKALPNSMALILPTYDSLSLVESMDKLNTTVAIVQALKPGNKLYVQALTLGLSTAIPLLQPQVVMLLNIENLTYPEASTIIQSLPPSCILGLIASKAVFNKLLANYMIKFCVAALPQGCTLKVTADMGLFNIQQIALFLPRDTALLIPRTLFEFPNWLKAIAINLNIRNARLMLPSGISSQQIDDFIESIPANLSIILPEKSLNLSSTQWRTLAEKNTKVAGRLVFPEDMQPSEKRRIALSLHPGHEFELNSTATVPVTISSSQLFPPILPSREKRQTPESPRTITSPVSTAAVTTFSNQMFRPILPSRAKRQTPESPWAITSPAPLSSTTQSCLEQRPNPAKAPRL